MNKKNFLFIYYFFLITFMFLFLINNMNNYFLFISFFIIITNLTLQVKRNGFFEPSSIVFFTLLPYILTEFYILYYNEYNSSYITKTNQLLVFFCVIFLSSYLFFQSYVKKIRTPEIIFYKRNNRINIFVIYLFIILIYSIYLYGWMWPKISSFSRAEIYSNKPLFFDLLRLSIYFFSVFYFWYMFFVKKISKNLLFFFSPYFYFILMDIFYFGDRKNAIITLLIYLYMYKFKNKIKIVYFILGLIFIFIMYIYSYLRSGSIYDWMNIINKLDYKFMLSPDNSEFGAFSIIWNEYLLKYTSVKMHLTYLEAFIQIIPTFFYSDRPISPAINFVKEFHPEIYSIGGGMAFNLILESMMNFWFFGPIVIAYIMVFFYKFYKKTPVGILFGSVFIFSFSFSMRNDMVSIIRIYILCSLVLFFSILVFCRAVFVKKSTITSWDIKEGLSYTPNNLT